MKFKIMKKSDIILLFYIPLSVVLFFAFSYLISTMNGLTGTGLLPTDMVANRSYDFSHIIKARPVAIIDGNLENRQDSITIKTYGIYSPVTNVISMDKIMLNPVYENLRLEVMRHEYGHVLMDDMLRRTSGDGFGGFIHSQLLFTAAKFINKSNGDFLIKSFFPKELQNVYTMYKKYGKNVYGKDMYGSDSFSEFFAEGYCFFLSNYKMPSDLASSYAAIAQMK